MVTRSKTFQRAEKLIHSDTHCTAFSDSTYE